MSMITLKEEAVAKADRARSLLLLHCSGRGCRDHFDFVEVPTYSSLSLRIAEVALVGTTFTTNLLLIVAIISARKLSGVSYYLS